MRSVLCDSLLFLYWGKTNVIREIRQPVYQVIPLIFGFEVFFHQGCSRTLHLGRYWYEPLDRAVEDSSSNVGSCVSPTSGPCVPFLAVFADLRRRRHARASNRQNAAAGQIVGLPKACRRFAQQGVNVIPRTFIHVEAPLKSSTRRPVFCKHHNYCVSIRKMHLLNVTIIRINDNGVQGMNEIGRWIVTFCITTVCCRVDFAIIIDVVNSNDSASSIANGLRIIKQLWLLGGDTNCKNGQRAFTDFASKSLASFLIVVGLSFPRRA